MKKWSRKMDINPDNEENYWMPEPTVAMAPDAQVRANAEDSEGRPWRPSSSARPMTGTGAEGPFGANDFAGPAPVAAHASGRRRAFPALVTAVSLVVAAGAGIGIGVAIKGSNSPVSTTSNGNSSSGGSSSGGTSSPFGGSSNNPFSGGSSSNGTSTTPIAGSGSPSNVSAIASKVTPGLVDINSTFNYQGASGAGTGIVVTSNGEVLTNNHVIKNATSISVTDLGNGKTYDATVVGYDDAKDVAVLQLQNASGLTTASIGDSSSATVGEPIVAIGNAGGTGGTPTSAGGSITGLNQSVSASDELDGESEQLTGLIGVNADVQPGDSGGPLVDAAGQVLGIDTAGESGSSTFEFSGPSSSSEAFAIPINTAMTIANQIEAGNGSNTIHVGATAFLGVEISPSVSSGGIGGFFGNGGGSGSSTATSGAVIASVISGGAAASAGVTAGDVITSFDGQSVQSSSAIASLLIPLHPGDKVQIAWTDTSGQTHTGTVTLGSGPPA
jgi:S1-C subfamily serine protease